MIPLVLDANIWSNGFDNSIAIWASELFDSMPSFLQNICIAISALGDYGIFLILLAILLLCFKKTRKSAVYIIVGLLAALIFNDLIFKNIFDRARPYEDPELVTQLVSVVNNGGIVYGIVPSSSSFPSGHSFEFFTVATLFTMEYICNKDKKEKRFYLPFMIFFIVLAVLVACTRVLLSHHYATDVIAGTLLGIALGIGLYYLVKWVPIWWKKFIARTKKRKQKDNLENVETIEAQKEEDSTEVKESEPSTEASTETSPQ